MPGTRQAVSVHLLFRSSPPPWPPRPTEKAGLPASHAAAVGQRGPAEEVVNRLEGLGMWLWEWAFRKPGAAFPGEAARVIGDLCDPS